MSTLAQNPAPPVHTGAKQRKWRNFLLDARFQLKFASYSVALTVVVAGLLGVFLYRTTDQLFRETAVAVEARSQAAETSRNLSVATLNNDLLQHMEDAAFETQLRERAAEIDRAYERERNAIIETRAQLLRNQQITLIALIGGFVTFIVFIGLASIVTSHRIVGPLHRIKKLAREVAGGRLVPPAYGLRPTDELKDVFAEFFVMIESLRKRHEDDLHHVTEALRQAETESASKELQIKLQTLEAKLKEALK
jgi:hypothetical protein